MDDFVTDLVKHIPIKSVVPALEDLVSFVKAEVRAYTKNDFLNLAIEPVLTKLIFDSLNQSAELRQYAEDFGKNIRKCDAVYDNVKIKDKPLDIAYEYVSHLGKLAHDQSIDLNVFVTSNFAGVAGNLVESIFDSMPLSGVDSSHHLMSHL